MPPPKPPSRDEVAAAFDAHLARLKEIYPGLPDLVENIHALGECQFESGSEAEILAESLLHIAAIGAFGLHEAARDLLTEAQNIEVHAREAAEDAAKLLLARAKASKEDGGIVPPSFAKFPEVIREIQQATRWMTEEVATIAGVKVITSHSEWLEHRRKTITKLVDRGAPPEIAHGCFPCEISAETLRKQMREFRTKGKPNGKSEIPENPS